MKNWKKRLAVILALALLAGALAGGALAASPTFSDVYADSWFVSDVGYVYQCGLMSGTGDGAFSPDLSVSRGMVVTILHRMDGSPAPETDAGFADVPAGSWYAQAVAWAAEAGVVQGYDAAAFGPEDPITREQLAVILYRYAAYRNYPTDTRGDLSPFADQGSISGYARDAVSWAVGLGFLNGADGALSPKGTATRCQAAAILRRFCEQEGRRIPDDAPAFVPAERADRVFAELQDEDFFFSSGVGGWATQLHINPDGSFTGNYHDSNMGETGPGYPYGTVYVCSFSGTLSQVRQLSSWEYTMTLSSLELEYTVGESWIENNMRFIAANPYGLDNAGELRLYRPGAPTAELPEEFVRWVSMPQAWGNDIPETLPFWGLYNVAGQQGFASDF